MSRVFNNNLRPVYKIGDYVKCKHYSCRKEIGIIIKIVPYKDSNAWNYNVNFIKSNIVKECHPTFLENYHPILKPKYLLDHV